MWGAGAHLCVLHRQTFDQQHRSRTCVQVFERMKDLGVLMGKGGLYGNVFRVKPPMCFGKPDADFLLGCFDQALSEL